LQEQKDICTFWAANCLLLIFDNGNAIDTYPLNNGGSIWPERKIRIWKRSTPAALIIDENAIVSQFIFKEGR